MKKLLVLLFLSVSVTLLSYDSIFEEKIAELGPNKNFAYVSLGLTNKELCLIDKIKFDKIPYGAGTSYERYGKLDLLRKEIPDFLIAIGNSDEEVIQAITEIICRTVNTITHASNKNSAWVSVRATTPTSLYDIPRWHIDGTYYGPHPYPSIVFKFAAVLKGAPTLLYNLPKEMRDLFISKMHDRAFLNELLDVNKAESPKRGEGTLFIVGNNEIAAVHSEPKKHENRLFFSVLIGNDSEIEELYLNLDRSNTYE